MTPEQESKWRSNPYGLLSPVQSGEVFAALDRSRAELAASQERERRLREALDYAVGLAENELGGPRDRWPNADREWHARALALLAEEANWNG